MILLDLAPLILLRTFSVLLSTCDGIGSMAVWTIEEIGCAYEVVEANFEYNGG